MWSRWKQGMMDAARLDLQPDRLRWPNRQQLCYWCGKRCGFFTPVHSGSEPTFNDCRAAAIVCSQCFERSWPPHLEYLQNLIGRFINRDPDLAHVISQFAFPVCIQPWKGFCCQCQPYWPGWTCPLCWRMTTRNKGRWTFWSECYLPTIADVHWLHLGDSATSASSNGKRGVFLHKSVDCRHR
jgi:hypothetical protein